MNQPNPAPRLRPVIRVFVSSTFSDMKHERNALAAEVYPKLEKLCQDHGFQFQAIDLRWGVSTEAGLDHRTMRICFDELRRAQEISPEPNFLVLLGDRYGWRPLPEAISESEFEALERVATTKATNSTSPPLRAGTNGEDRRGQGLDPQAVLRAWYRCDENVLLPEPPEADPDRVSLNYILQPRQNLSEGRDYTRTKAGKDPQEWLDVQQVLWSLINTAFPPEGRWFDGMDWERHVGEVNIPQYPKRAIPRIARFQASATEQEIWCGALSAANAERHVFACFREIANRGEFTAAEVKEFFDRTDSGEFDHAAAARQTALKEAIQLRLGKNKPLRIPFSRLKRESDRILLDASEADTKVFCDAVFEHLRPIIERQIEEYWNKSTQGSPERATRELKIEQDEHQRFGRERGGKETFVGREVELKAIRAYLQNASRQPQVHQAGRSIIQEQRKTIEQRLTSPACRQPIYLKLLFEEARLWRSYDTALELGEDVPALLKQLFDRLSQPANHGPLLVDRVLGYLAASRHGLAETEILEILFDDPEYKKALDDATETNRHEMPPNATRIPIAIWSRLRFDLAPYLAERAAVGANVLTFYHRQVAEWVLEHFERKSEPNWHPHRRLADFFRKLADPKEDRSWQGASVRPFQEIAFHLIGAQQWNSVCAYLTDLSCLDRRVRDEDVFGVVADQHMALTAIPELANQAKRDREQVEMCRRYGERLAEYAHEYAAAQSSAPSLMRRLWRKMSKSHRFTKFRVPVLPDPPNVNQTRSACDVRDSASHPTERLAVISGFFSNHATLLSIYSADFLPLAANFDDGGPLAEAESILSRSGRVWIARAPRPPSPILASYSLLTMAGHTEAVSSVSLTPDRRIAVSGSYDHSVRIWDITSGRCIYTLHGHGEPVLCVCVTPNGKRAVSGGGDIVGTDYALRLWDLDSGECLDELRGHTRPIYGVAVTADGQCVVSCSGDGTLRVWRTDSRHCCRILKGHKDIVRCVCVTPDGRLAVSGSDDGSLRVWELASGRCLRVCRGHGGLVYAVSVTPDGKRIVSGSDDRTLRVWDADFSQCLHILKGHADLVACVDLTADGHLAVSGGNDDTLRLWDLDLGQYMFGLDNNLQAIFSVCVTADGLRALTGNSDGTVRLWNINGRRAEDRIQTEHRVVQCLSQTPDGHRSFAANSDKTLSVWDADSGQRLRDLVGHSEAVCSVSVNPDGRRRGRAGRVPVRDR